MGDVEQTALLMVSNRLFTQTKTMTDCCPPDTRPLNKEAKQRSKRHVCPKNGQQYLNVPFITLLHHVKETWEQTPKEQDYYFCSDPDCDVVYFGHDDSVILKGQLRTKVGIKESSDDALICYCFGISKSEANKCKQTKSFVIDNTKHSLCSCTTRNPSGRCCLKDFP
jgi:hypothetical protein